jgi:hypothetical protein
MEAQVEFFHRLAQVAKDVFDARAKPGLLAIAFPPIHRLAPLWKPSRRLSARRSKGGCDSRVSPKAFGAVSAQHRFDEALAIRIVPEDRLAPVAAIQDVVDRTGMLDSQLAGHDGRVARATSCVNIKNQPLYGTQFD